jgi:hypothetical protein
VLLGVFQNGFQLCTVYFLGRSGGRACESTPLSVFFPVTMGVPAAESVTQELVEEVSESAICGMRCR